MKYSWSGHPDFEMRIPKEEKPEEPVVGEGPEAVESEGPGPDEYGEDSPEDSPSEEVAIMSISCCSCHCCCTYPCHLCFLYHHGPFLLLMLLPTLIFITIAIFPNNHHSRLGLCALATYSCHC